MRVRLPLLRLPFLRPRPKKDSAEPMAPSAAAPLPATPSATESLAAAMARLTSLGGEEARAKHDLFARDLAELLDADPASVPDFDAYLAALRHGFSYYFWSWDKRACALHARMLGAIARWPVTDDRHMALMCELTDFLFFLVWCFEESSTRQSALLIEPLRLASEKFAAAAPPRDLGPPPAEGPYRIAWLGSYVQSQDAMSVALRVLAPPLRALGHELDVYAWRFVDEGFSAHLRGLGARVHELARPSAVETIHAVEALAQRERPDIVISDMNGGVPTALFSRRLAPVQIFLQAGMPAWPVRHLNGVFNSFGFDPAKAGWGDAAMLRFNAPWDLHEHNPPVPVEEIARERAALPAGVRLVGSYGRFSKVTRPYLQAVERILLRCPDVHFALGGTGDAAHIHAFLAASPVAARVSVQERFVPGHAWGHILDLLLDTWPVTGGISAREMLAKGKPVVTMYSEEMPAMMRQRDPALLATDWDAYVDRAVELLQDASAYAAASQRAVEMVRRFADARVFLGELEADLRLAVRHAQQAAG